MARSRMHRRYVKNSAPKSNPPLFADMVEFAVPGFASFAVARFATRIATQQLGAWKPSLGKHAGAGVAIGTFLAAWFLGHKVKWLEKYHTPLVVGAAISMAASVIQLYIPRLGWMLDAVPEAPATSSLVNPDVVNDMQLRTVDDDPNEYTYNDSFDAGRYTPAKVNASDPTADVSDLAMDDAIGQSGSLGVFAAN